MKGKLQALQSMEEAVRYCRERLNLNLMQAVQHKASVTHSHPACVSGTHRNISLSDTVLAKMYGVDLKQTSLLHCVWVTHRTPNVAHIYLLRVFFSDCETL